MKIKRFKPTLSLQTILILVFNWFGPSLANAEATVTLPPVLISEVQTGTISGASEEFIELYNPTNTTVDLTGWRLEYKPASGSDWSNRVANPDSPGLLTGQIQPRGYYLLATTSYLLAYPEVESNGSLNNSGLAASGGHVRLVGSDLDGGDTIDLIGWGTADSAEGGQPVSAADAGQSIKRRFLEGLIVDTDNNFNDWLVSSEPTPTSTPPPADSGEPPAGPVPSEPESNCGSIIISELLPNPAGSDSGREFIELYNPTTTTVPLNNCGLQTSANTTIYWFSGGIELKPETYTAFYNDETDLTLPNSAGGTAYLLSHSEEELYSTTYTPNFEDDLAWGWFGTDNWKTTYQPTPNAANILQAIKPCPAGQERSEDTGRCRNIDPGESGLAPCDTGQERNPATNRCRSVLAAANSLKPCSPGQTRNPATNRCRSDLSTSTLIPCGPGQERNPTTNRCRKIVTAGSNLKPCGPGQERNPQTNRCRNIANISGGSDGLLAATAAVPTSPLTGGMVATTAGLALVYGAYEFRGDIRNKIELLRRHFSIRTHAGE